LSEAYIPLYRKYRPQKFNDLVGQGNVVKALSNAVNLEKIAHAYLFTGSRGTGKTSSARILAKSLNCIEGPTTNPCGKCPSCIDISNSNSIDVIEIDAASNRNVEDARNLIDKVHFMPVSGKYKVYIIDEVHMLTPAAFNTLLKTLEEPPKNLVFILATTESHKVLNTIISRCQRFDFRRVNQEVVAQRLREIAETENIKINDKALSVIARRCHGGMRDALGLLDQVSVLSSCEEEITENEVISLMGSMPEDIMFKIASCFADRDSVELITLIDEIITANEPVQVIRELINYFKNLLFAKCSDNPNKIKDLIDVSPNLLPDLIVQGGKFETSEIVQIIEKLSECEKTLKSSSQQFLWLEVGLIGICHRHDIQVIKDLESRLARLEEINSSGNITAAKPANIPVKPVEIKKPEPAFSIEQKSSAKQESVMLNSNQALPSSESPQEAKTSDNIPENNKQPEVIPEAKQQLKPVPEHNINKQAFSVNNDSPNTLENWKTLLDNMESIPPKMFFNSLATPVEISAEKITITFKNEGLVKQSKEDKTKTSQLEKAAEKMFGTLPKILIRTPLEEDKSLEKKNSEIKPAEPQKTQQISTPITEELSAAPKRGQVAIAEKPVSDEDRELADELEEIGSAVKPINIPEQAKHVLDLFNGKIIED